MGSYWVNVSSNSAPITPAVLVRWTILHKHSVKLCNPIILMEGTGLTMLRNLSAAICARHCHMFTQSAFRSSSRPVSYLLGYSPDT